MSYLAVNWLAIILATIASMALGFAWYMLLAKQWMAALGRRADEISSGDVSPYIWSVIVQLVMAYFTALFTPALFGAVTPVNGVLTGLHVWVGFVVTTMILNHRYQGAKWSLTAIDSGYVLGVLVLQGLVIGLLP